jgi:hypothetical protein
MLLLHRNEVVLIKGGILSMLVVVQALVLLSAAEYNILYIVYYMTQPSLTYTASPSSLLLLYITVAPVVMYIVKSDMSSTT